MKILAQIILFVLSIYSFFDSVIAFSKAQSAMHQIYASLMLILFVVCIAGLGIISSIQELKGSGRKYSKKSIMKSAKENIKIDEQETADKEKSITNETPTKHDGPEKEKLPEENKTKRCPHCGEINDIDAKYCPKCINEF